MSFSAARPGRPGVPDVVAAPAAWTPPVWGGQLHPGDIGWELRFEDDHVDGSLVVVREGDAVVAVGLLDDPTALRVAVDPSRAFDDRLAQYLADAADDLLAPGEAFVDGLPLAGWRTVLADRGWELDADAWVALHRPVAGLAPELPAGVAPVVTADDVEGRVAVQRASFESSTFTAARWALMAAGPPYDGALDLLARDTDGTPVATGTAWSAGPGRCGLLEPVGTHRDHRRRGHGRRLLDGLCAQLAAAGASSVAVATPASNHGGVQSYRAAGFRAVALLRAMRRPAR